MPSPAVMDGNVKVQCLQLSQPFHQCNGPGSRLSGRGNVPLLPWLPCGRRPMPERRPGLTCTGQAAAAQFASIALAGAQINSRRACRRPQPYTQSSPRRNPDDRSAGGAHPISGSHADRLRRAASGYAAGLGTSGRPSSRAAAGECTALSRHERGREASRAAADADRTEGGL